MSVISRAGAGAFAAALLCAAAGGATPDDMIDLGRVGLTVMGVDNRGFVNPGAVFPVSAVGPLDGTPILARGTTNDMTSAELLGYTVGRALSEQEPDYAIGEYCTDYGGKDAAEVDWKRTGEAIAKSDAFRGGFVKFINSLQAGADRRILFTAGGAVDIEWYYKDVESPVRRTYTIASRTSGRPYRLYATRADEPNEAAYVDLSGKFVEFFGASNLLSHIDYDKSGSKRLTYRYTVTTNEIYRTEEVHCEQGQFVLAYYDTESRGNLLATIVVEVVPPTVHTLDATVGSELRPDGGGYDVDGLVATISAGDKADKDDPYAPYVEKFTAPLGLERQSPCHGKVYAITPTDASTSLVDMPMPWKVDIYWRMPDPMGTLWTFENDWYNITWPKDALKVVVSGDSSEPGTCLTVPTNYSAVVTGYREPATLVVGSTAWGEVLADVEGKFLVRVEASVDPLRAWYLPVETCLREGGRNTHFVRAPRTFDWPVGKELTLVSGEAAGDGEIAGVASRMSSFLPAYVHEQVSTGRNWNPRLYHRPSPEDDFTSGIEGEVSSFDLPAVDIDDDGTNETITATGETDPYARLGSAVYGVNSSDTPIEVWWRGMVFEEGMEAPITYPGLVERYRVYWDETPGLFPEIALSSQRGSGGKMGAFTGRSFVFTSSNGVARIYSPDLDGLESVEAPERDENGGEPEAFHLGLRLMPPEVTDATRTLGLGRILTLANTNGVDNAELVLDLEEAEPDCVVIVASVLTHVGRRTERTECASFELKRGKWSSVTLSLPEYFLGDDLDFTLGGGGRSAVGVAFDDVALWWGAGITRPAKEEEYLFNFDFDMDDLETFGPAGLRVAVDANGLTMVVSGGQALDVGTYGSVDGYLYAEDGVAPELYWQNDPKKPGYNPNEEHAFLRQDGADEKRYVAWALRNDLNLESDPNATPPYVLAMYPRNGRGEMRMYRVVACNADYPEFSCEVTVGQKMAPPAPLGLVEGCCSANNAVCALAPDPEAMPVMTDRNFEMWARCNGPSDVYYFYKMQPGFCCPSLGSNQIEDGEYVSWMSCATEAAREPEDFSMPEIDVNFVPEPDEGADDEDDLDEGDDNGSDPKPVSPPPPDLNTLLHNRALPWRWVSDWPSNTVPTMKIGQTLVQATENLPEMFNASSMAVLWPVSNTCPVKVVDPTQVRHGGSLTIGSNFAQEYGFTLGNTGTCQLRKGKYYFTGLPPSLSDRFYVDANAAASNSLCLVGTWVAKPSGGSYLLPNVLSDQERQAIKDICKKGAPRKKEWDAAVSTLAKGYVLPSPYRYYQGKMSNPDATLTEKVLLPPKAKKDFTAYFNSVTNGTTTGYEITISTNTYGEVDLELKLRLGKDRTKKGIAEVSYEFEKGTKTSNNKDDQIKYESVWQKRIPALASYPWPTNTNAKLVSCQLTYKWKGGPYVPKCDYANHDHYALVADGSSSGWVVLIENDDPDTSRVPEGTPVQLHVLRVLPALYTDGIAVLTDPLNKLSEQLTLHYRMPFGPGVDQFAFDWRRRQPDASGGIDRNYKDWDTVVATNDQRGHIDHHLVGTNVEDYVNNYYTLHYRPDTNSVPYKYLQGSVFKVNGKTYDYKTENPEVWSDWCEPQLAEGWLQRVLNTVTPFAQRVDDFYSNESDIKYTMFEQIGGPYQGDVALNNDNLANVGLLELYRTLFNRVETILVTSSNNLNPLTKSNLCKQLLLAGTRIAQFYAFLGADAYADAKNPLISQGRDEFWEQEVPAADYSFANQVPSLLDEELALLRGLTSATAYPNKREAPCYNRLRWNLTRGMTEGEVAYVNNYGIQSDKGALDVNCAANQYPQGHGDAWGHYLSALSTYYRLIRNPEFDWPVAMGEMLMDQTVANVDYQDEEKFADAVEKLVQTGLDTMALTFRKAYKESGAGGVGAGYFDADAEQAFGYGEWAARTGMNAIYGWMAGNALLPDAESAKKEYRAFADRGVSKIDRSTAPQLTAVCTLMRNLDQRLNDFEAGLNPLGLSENAVPFDIDPDELAAKNTHFEQILARAEKALGNCRTVLDYANVYGSQLARIQNAEADAATEKETRELEFKQQLIAVFGTPYPEDCGVNGMYAQDYDGPDIYDYNYMDLDEFGIKYPLDTVFTNSYDWYSLKFNLNPSRTTPGNKYQQNYYVNQDGIRIKPANFGKKRAMEGSIQAAYRDYLTAYSALKGSMGAYERSVSAYNRVYARRVATLTKWAVDWVLGWLTKFASAKLSAGDTNKMIGAMLAQSFSSATLDYKGTGEAIGGTGTLLDGGEANRVKIFERFYKGYLEKIGLHSSVTNNMNLMTSLAEELQRAELDLKIAQTNASARHEACYSAGKRLSRRGFVMVDADNNKTPLGMRIDAQGNWNGNEDENLNLRVRMLAPCCWYWSRNENGKNEVENWVRIKDGVTNYADDEGPLGISKLAAFLRDQIISKTEHWHDLLYPEVEAQYRWTDAESDAVLNVIISPDDWWHLRELAELKLRENDPNAKVVGRLTLTDDYKELLKNEMKNDFEYEEQQEGDNASEPSLKTTYEQYVAAMQVVRTKQETYDKAKKAYEDTFGGDVDTNDSMNPEAGMDRWDKFVARFKNWSDKVWKDPQMVLQITTDVISQGWGLSTAVLDACTEVQAAALAVHSQIVDIRNKTAVLAGCEAAYRAELYKGEEILEARELWRRQFSNNAVQYRYLDMFDRIQRSTALTKYSTAFDTAQRYVWELAKVYDYETGLLKGEKQAGDRFLAEIVGTRSLGREGVPVSSGTTDGGLYDIVARLKGNWDVIKPRLGMNNADKPEKWFSLRWERYRLGRDEVGGDAWKKLFKPKNRFKRADGGLDDPIYCDNILADPDFVRYCQPLANSPNSAAKSAEPGFIFRFETSIYNAQNFFGQPLIGGDNQFSAADYATKIDAVGVYFENYDRAVDSVSNRVNGASTVVALAKEPNVYLVPIGEDVMRSPAGTAREELCWKVVDQVLPLPYTIGSTELDNAGWISSMVGFDGTSDSGAVIRRHSTLRAGYNFTSTRLVGRSAWNRKWMLVIPASSLNFKYKEALDKFAETVTDIKIGIRAYSRQGN